MKRHDTSSSGMRMEWIAQQLAALSGEDLPSAVLALVSLAALSIAAWLGLVTALATCPALRGLALALTPRVFRGLLLAGMAGALTVPAAQADERGELDGLRLPDRPLVAEKSVDSPPASTVVVGPGDTLWAIVRDDLGPHADTSATARAVNRWHRANRDVIGNDPNLIRPGQQLTAPSKERS